jgi:hypothetical protein
MLSQGFRIASAFSHTEVSAIESWAMPLVSVEAIVPLGIGALVIARAINIRSPGVTLPGKAVTGRGGTVRAPSSPIGISFKHSAMRSA